MIEDSRVLKEEFIPHEVEHRHEEVNRLSDALEPCLNGEAAENSMLFGDTGTGKTCIARFTLNKLQEASPNVSYHYVNCWQDYNRFRVIYRILEGQGRSADIRRRSTPKDELLERLRDGSTDPFIVILDEVDQLEDTKVLYDLYTVPYISMVLIANRETELFHYLGDRVASRLKGSVRIQFDAYSVAELVSILESRVQWGLAPGVISQEELELIADLAAGDARVAIGILRSAAHIAEREGHDEITTEVIKAAVPEARDEVDERTIQKLNEHQRILYEIIQDREEIDPKPLYETYRERIDDPVTDRTIRKYLTKMDQYDLIDAVGEGRGRVYRLPR